MSETKFTPGPWKVFRGTHGFGFLGVGDLNAEGITDSYFNLWRGFDAEAEANACLIAAAPDLYEALEELLNFARPFTTFRDDVGQVMEKRVRDVLSKARGEQP